MEQTPTQQLAPSAIVPLGNRPHIAVVGDQIVVAYDLEGSDAQLWVARFV